MSEIKVSVVIPTLNSAQMLGTCLTSVRSNKTRHKFEIIVVDAGSSDETLTIAQKHAAKVLNGTPFRINRNKGVAEAKGEIICFTDSDCIVPEDWVDKLVDGLLRLNERDNKIIGVGGGNIPLVEIPSLMELAISRTLSSPFVAFRARNTAIYQAEREVSHNPPLNSACFKYAIEQVGGFEEEPGYGYGEDSALDAKFIEKGYKLYYLPTVVVQHKHPSTWKGFVRQMYAYGWGRAKLGRRFKKYFKLHHYGPIFLALMTFSPLFFIPLGMGLANGACMSLKERNPRLFLPLTFLTMSFYVSYGFGEIATFIKAGE